MQSRRTLLFIVLYLIPLSGVGTDLYAPSLPAIVTDLSTSISLVKFTLAIYLFGFSIGQFSFGTLSDIHGRKPILITSLALFCMASLAATLVHNIYFLLAIRVLQGFSAAGPSVASKAMLTDTLSGSALKKASIYLITVWGLSPIIAPGIGGYLQHYFGWTSNFYFFAVYSFSMWALVVYCLKETNLNRHEPKWKTIFTNYKSLITHPVFVANVICMALAYSIIMIFNIITPFLVQSVLGYSAITYGHLAMIVGVGFLTGSLSNRWLMHHFDTRLINRVGIVLMMLSAILSLLIAYFLKMSLVTLAAPVFIMVLVAGLMQTNFMTYNLSLFPKMGGTASAMIGGLLCFIAGITSTGGSLIHHTTGQVTVSWIYFVLIMLYAGTYWLIIDKSSLQKH